jgi:hypothetical protein
MAQITKIMNTLLQFKQQLAILEIECNLLKNMVEATNNDALPMDLRTKKQWR